MNCPNCGVKIPETKIRKELRRCSKCDEPIGCTRCRTPGTFAFKFCAMHDPRGAFTDDKLFNPCSTSTGNGDGAEVNRTEIKKLIRLLEKECKKYDYIGYRGYEKLEETTKSLANRMVKIGKPVVPELIKVFEDKRRKKKSGFLYMAAHILGDIKDEETLKPLCDALYRETDIAHAAGDALMKFGEQAIPPIENLIYLPGTVSGHAAYVLSGIKSNKSVDLLIRGAEYKLKTGDWENLNNCFVSMIKYSKKFNDRRTSNYVHNIGKRIEKRDRILNNHEDWKNYALPGKETFYSLLGVDKNKLNGLSDKEIRRFLRCEYMHLKKTPETNLAYDALKKTSLRKDYDWMLLNYEFIEELSDAFDEDKFRGDAFMDHARNTVMDFPNIEEILMSMFIEQMKKEIGL